jgi:hypothetical protein
MSSAISLSAEKVDDAFKWIHRKYELLCMKNSVQNPHMTFKSISGWFPLVVSTAKLKLIFTQFFFSLNE